QTLRPDRLSPRERFRPRRIVAVAENAAVADQQTIADKQAVADQKPIADQKPVANKQAVADQKPVVIDPLVPSYAIGTADGRLARQDAAAPPERCAREGPCVSGQSTSAEQCPPRGPGRRQALSD